jgi:hypothetical protein
VYDKSLSPNREKYRIVGIDFSDTCKKECGFTYYHPQSLSWKNSVNTVFVNFVRCYPSHVVIHELGHTFSLCDDYNPNIWDVQNEERKVLFGLLGGGCPNPKPTPQNSDCINCETSGACCLDIRFPDGTYSIMGSADDVYNGRLIIRKFDDVSSNTILKWIEEVEAK